VKIFVSYAATGEDPAKVKQLLERVRDALEELHVSYHINCFADGYESLIQGKATPDEYLRFAFNQLGDSGVALILMTSPRRSEGMLMEVGVAAWLKKRIILAQHESSVGQTYLPTIADETFIWQTEDDLFGKLEDKLRPLIHQ